MVRQLDHTSTTCQPKAPRFYSLLMQSSNSSSPNHLVQLLLNMSYGDPHQSSQLYDDLSDALQYKQYPQSYLAASQKHPQHAEIPSALTNLTQLPSLPHQISGQGDGGDGTGEQHVYHRHAQLHPPHDLYPAPPNLEPLSPATTPQQHHNQPNGWPQFDHGLALGFPPNYGSYPTSSPFPPPRLTPPPAHHMDGGNQVHGAHRLTLAGSLDPSTGIFYRTPEHPRLRTAQACEKCRTRKAKCSGEHPSCNRCQARGLICEYAKEGRVRGPNKPKNKSGNESRSTSSSRPSSVHGSIQPENLEIPVAVINLHQSQPDKHMSLPLSFTPRTSSMSLGEHRSTRPRPPDLRLESASNHYRLDGPRSARALEGGRRLSQQYIPSQGGLQPSITRFSQRSHTHSHSVDSHLRDHSTIFQTLPLQTALQMDDINQFTDDAGSSCSSSNASGQSQGPSVSAAMLSHTHAAYLHQREHSNSNSEGGSLSNPHSAVSLTFNSSPTSAIGSPITPASSLFQFNRDGDHYSGGGDVLQANLGSQQQQNVRASLQIDPVWADVHSNPDFGGQFRRLEKNGWENLPPNDSYHRDTEHPSLPQYPMDLQMC